MSTYDYYRIFYHVAQHHSFTKAAEVLHNNQPNITRCMNNLETELGCHLFVRSNRGVSLTPEGQKLFNHVAIAFEQLELGEAELKRDQSLTSGLISIGVSENALRIMLLSKLEAFHNHYPHVRLKISNHSTPQAIASLESGLVDFAIVTTPLSAQKQFQKISLGSFREILIAGPKYKEPASRIWNKELKKTPRAEARGVCFLKLKRKKQKCDTEIDQQRERIDDGCDKGTRHNSRVKTKLLAHHR